MRCYFIPKHFYLPLARAVMTSQGATEKAKKRGIPIKKLSGKKVFVQHAEGWNTGASWGPKKQVVLIVTPKGSVSYKGFGGYPYSHYEGKGVWSRYEGSEHLLRVTTRKKHKGKRKGKRAQPEQERSPKKSKSK